MIPKKVLTYVEKLNIPFQTVEHRQVFTAHDLAMTLHINHRDIGKNLLLKAGGDYILAVIPADRNVDFKKLAKLSGVAKVNLPKEQVMKTKYRVKPGALPAFGGLYHLPVYVDKALLRSKEVLLSSGSFVDSIRMKPRDFVKIEQAVVGLFTVAKKFKKQKPAPKKKTSRAKVKVKKTKVSRRRR